MNAPNMVRRRCERWLGAFGVGALAALAACGTDADEQVGDDARPPEIARATHAGKNVGTVAAHEAGFACSLAVDDAGVYWIDLRTGAATRSEKDGRSSSPLGTIPVVGHAVAVDASGVYVLSERAPESYLRGSIWRVGKAPGGRPVLLAIDELPLNGLALDERDVFWTGHRSTDHRGVIRRLAK
jgi:hypothetical protein